MRITIDMVYSRIGNQWVRNITSCGKHLFSRRPGRIVIGLIAVWYGPGKGLMLGDAGYWRSYGQCPNVWARFSRWLAFRTGALPTTARPEAERS
jgi:hypothetical protein